jgi:hypothetical protein
MFHMLLAVVFWGYLAKIFLEFLIEIWPACKQTCKRNYKQILAGIGCLIIAMLCGALSKHHPPGVPAPAAAALAAAPIRETPEAQALRALAPVEASPLGN